MSTRNIIIILILFIGTLFVASKKPFTSSTTEIVSAATPVKEIVPMKEPLSPSLPIETIVEEPTLPGKIASHSSDDHLPPDTNLIDRLFATDGSALPIVETVRYVSRVPWLNGRSAYLGDWATYYETSKHFISRSMKGIGNYFHENVSRGDRFNVFRKDKNIEFHLIVDLSRTKMWLYYFDKEENQSELLKTYPVCVGKLSAERNSGSLTPLGIFEVGQEIAIYKEGDMGLYKGEPCEMITIFGQRWIPLSREIADCTGSCKGLGLHGVPWTKDSTGKIIERRECVGQYSSLGCLRFLTEDIQEIFSIIISKPSYVHIVKDFQDAKLPGMERLHS